MIMTELRGYGISTNKPNTSFERALRDNPNDTKYSILPKNELRASGNKATKSAPPHASTHLLQHTVHDERHTDALLRHAVH